MAVSRARAAALCTASELKVVQSSGRQAMSRMSAAELRRAEAQARKLRDKWRDQAAGQRRKAQAKAGARDAGANRRSAQKAALFDEVLGRFSAQLAKMEAAGETAGPMGRKRSTRSVRSRTHRATRSEVRGGLASAKRELKSKKPAKAAAPSRKQKKKVVEPVPPVEVFPASGGGRRPNEEPPAEVTQPKRSGRPAAAELTGLAAGRKVQGLRVTKKQQLMARTAAKQDRLKKSGLVRIQKNRAAANRRQQGRRDAR